MYSWESGIFVDVEGNHELSFASKNRLKLNDITLEAFRLMEKGLPLVEFADDYEHYDEHDNRNNVSYHYHELFLYLGDVEGRKIYLRLAEVRYGDDED